ncbi:MGDG synthase family glycosyltransferase [Tepidibacillus marianensis]|uniref:MGDG synthase family glycosyltransferase n=1 Tax=Tepidibacillus marianensis TaxID=3131995 RepID=UPI0030CBBCE2
MKNKHGTVLIISSSFGDGHVQVSKAIQDHFKQHRVEQIKVIDLLAEAHPYLNAVSRFVYLKSTSLVPSIYGWVYYRSQHFGYNGLFYKWLNLLGITRLKSYIQEIKPDLIINTFPFMAMGELRKRTNLSIPTYTIITDFTLHQRWLHTEIDKYYVATEDLKDELIQSGIEERKVKVTGIPVRDIFETTTISNDIQKNFGFDQNKNYVLVMAGAYGVQQNIKTLCQKLLEINEIEVLVICGKNEKLLKEMESQFKGKKKFIFLVLLTA